MDLPEQIVIAAGSIITGAMSLWIALKKTSADRKLGNDKNSTEHTETILGGYSNIVEDLREEVSRLNGVIIDLRKDQVECERRNDEMVKIVNELRSRVSCLEGKNNGQI